MKLTLVKKVDEARDTKSFFFEPEENITWQAGQYFYITLSKLNYNDPKGDIRHFTVSSSPTEGNLIRLTTRIRQESGYKKTLDELPIGTVVEGKGPQGTFLFEKNINPNIFLAGGIGITPFRSMIKWNIDKNLKIPMHLIYSNSDSEFVFKSELDKLQSENSYIKVTYFDSSVSGHLDAVKLSSLLPTYDILNTIYYVVGPPAFVNAMEEVLENLKIPEDKQSLPLRGQIKTEKFTGY